MATTSDLKRGMRIEMEGEPYQVVDLSTQSPTARGSSTLIRVKLRNLKTKQLLSHTFKAGERIKEPDFEVRACQYLYDENGERYIFMDESTYEQYTLEREAIEDAIGFLRPNDRVLAHFFEGECLGIQLEPTVVLEVVFCEPGFRGDTATHTTKLARLETGLEVQVPLFIEVGEKLVIDTRESRYVRRA